MSGEDRAAEIRRNLAEQPAEDGVELMAYMPRFGVPHPAPPEREATVIVRAATVDEAVARAEARWYARGLRVVSVVVASTSINLARRHYRGLWHVAAVVRPIAEGDR